MSDIPPTPADGFPAGNAATMQEVLLGPSTGQKPLSSGFLASPGQVWTPPTAEILQPCFPQYQILSLLGRGGMGAVYKAWQKSLSRHVAIKVLPPLAGDADESYTERFKQEARSMAQLSHPGIIAVYDAGETPEGLLYFVMEFIEGTDVHQMVAAAGHLPPEHAHAITAHVCEALAYAHATGIVHRDIKPANIMVDHQGHVKVADFGLAKLTTQGGGLTQTNMAMGTPDFVSPEALIPGVPLDGRADLYAVGVMLYQMLTGKVPRGAWSPASVVVPGLDPRWDAIITKAMQMDREARHSSAIELRQHLDSVLQNAPAATAVVPPPVSKPISHTSHRKPIMLAAATFAILASGAFLALRPSASPDKTEAPAGGTPPILVAQANTQPKNGAAPQAAQAGPTMVTPARKPNPTKWVKLDPMVDCWTSYKTKFEDGGWRVGGNGETARLATKKKFQDVAIRARIQVIDKSASLEVRIVSPEDGDKVSGSYRVGIRAKGVEIGRTLEENGEKTDGVLAFYPLPAGVDLAKEVLTTISACGPVLTVWIEGQELGSVRDDHFSSGTMALWSYEAVFRDVEYQVLDDAAPPAAVAAATATVASPAPNAGDTGKWVKLDPKVDCWGSKGLTELADAWQIAFTRIRTKGTFDDCAIRARLDAPSRSQGLAVRIMDDGFYQLSLKGDNVLLLRVNTSAEPFTYENLKVFTGAVADIPKEGVVLGLRAEGDVLTASVGNKVLGSISDATFNRGAIGCVAGVAADFRDIEYQVINGAAASPAPPPVVAVMPVASTSAPLPPELVTLQQQYDKLVVERVSGIHEADRAKLNTGYRAGLERAVATAQTAGELDAVLAIQEEDKRVKAAGAANPVPAKDEAQTPAALKSLRGIYRSSLAQLDEQRAANHAALLTPYLTRLRQLETDFTKAGRIPDAVLVKAYRESLGTAAPAATATPSAQTATPKETAAATAVPGKGDDRSAALMVLGKGGTVFIEVKRERREVRSLNDLPKEAFELQEVVIGVPYGPAVSLSEAEMGALAGLQNLERLWLTRTPLSDDSLRVVQTLPKLARLGLKETKGLTDKGLAHLSGLKNLTALEINAGGSTGISSTGILHLASLTNLSTLHLVICPGLDDHALPALLKMRKLHVLHLHGGGQVGKDFIEDLAALPELRELSLSPRHLTPSVNLGRLKALRLLGMVGHVATDTLGKDGWESLTSQPKLERISFKYMTITEDDLQKVAEMPMLAMLELVGDALPAAGLAALADAKITRFMSSGAQFDDALLRSLTPIKSLKTVVVGGGSAITATGVTSFQKSRPDVKLEK